MALDLSFTASEDIFAAQHQAETPTSINNDDILQTPNVEQTQKFLRPQHHSEGVTTNQSSQKKRPSLSRKRKNGERDTSCKRPLFTEQQQQ